MVKVNLITEVNTITDLEKEIGVKVGDLIMCTYQHIISSKTLNLAVGLYNPYQSNNGRSSGISIVNFTHRAKQIEDLVKSDKYFRVHSIGHGLKEAREFYSTDALQIKIPIQKVVDFRIIMKAYDVTQFYRKSI
jgi:hypothetical protein